jgi:hypothetical protein
MVGQQGKQHCATRDLSKAWIISDHTGGLMAVIPDDACNM